MGYFNIFYKITRIIDMLTRKRNRRAIMVILIIIAVIFILHNKGYCAQDDSTYTTDTTYIILEEYQNCVNDFVMAFDKYYNVNTTFTNNVNSLFNMLQNGWYMYFDTTSSILYPKIYMYKADYSQTLVDTSLVYNPYLRVPSTAYNITLVEGDTFFNFNRPNYWIGVGSVPSNNINIAVPQIMLYKTNVEVIELMHRAGIGYYANESAIVDIKALLQTQNQKLDNINNSLTNTTYDENVVDFDTDSVDNVDDTEITGLFTGVIGSFSDALNTYGGTITKIIPLPRGRTN